MRPVVAVFALLTLALPALPQQSRAAEVAQTLRTLSFDPQQCYRVRDLNIGKEDANIYFTDGYVMFARPLGGRIIAAMFSAEVESGDAELLLLPPEASERRALASFTQSPNLNEHFRSAIMLFTDSTGDELLAQIKDRASKPTPEYGSSVEAAWSGVLRNMASSFEVRLVADLLENAPKTNGMFYMGITGTKLGNFDLVYDPMSKEQLSVGQVVNRDNRVFFDLWTSFEARSFRQGKRKTVRPLCYLENYVVRATIGGETLQLAATVEAELTDFREPAAVLAFDVSKAIRIKSVKIDGESVEVFQRESMRSNRLRGRDNDMFLAVPAKPLDPTVRHKVEFEEEGDVIIPTGNNVFYVSARGNWYPQNALHYTNFDLTFRYPKNLGVVSTGDVVEDKTEGEWHITRRRTKQPVRNAGFNLGQYIKYSETRGNLNIDVFANKNLEVALERSRAGAGMPPPITSAPPRFGGRRGMEIPPVQDVTTPPRPRGEALASELADSFEYFASKFGPPAVHSLSVSPVPAAFGQGFPGMIYISTLAYLDPRDRPASIRSAQNNLFFSEILSAHEVAHQWWGNRVTTSGYRHEWLMESLSNYSALLFLEKKKGTKALDSALESFRTGLLAQNDEHRTVDSFGPIALGWRLENSQNPAAYRAIVYDKGAWIIHMLRKQMGDAAFFALLTELPQKYEGKAISMDEFRLMAAAHLPPKSPDPKLEAFFDTWVYGTGIPTLRMTQTIKGKAPKLTLTCTITQTDVPAEFSALVPVEVQIARGKSRIEWVRTDNEPVSVTFNLAAPPLKVTLDPLNAVLAQKK